MQKSKLPPHSHFLCTACEEDCKSPLYLVCGQCQVEMKRRYVNVFDPQIAESQTDRFDKFVTYTFSEEMWKCPKCSMETLSKVKYESLVDKEYSYCGKFRKSKGEAK